MLELHASCCAQFNSNRRSNNVMQILLKSNVIRGGGLAIYIKHCMIVLSHSYQRHDVLMITLSRLSLSRDQIKSGCISFPIFSCF